VGDTLVIFTDEQLLHAQRLGFQVSCGMGLQPDIAEDIGQEIALAVWQHPDLYDPELGAFETWVRSIARKGEIACPVYARLSEDDHKLLWSHLEGYEAIEIGEKMTLPPATIHKRLQRVKIKLTAMSNHDPRRCL
jgi:DNA-directed RNA polymerase specialized sigma24 family protein